jgi:transposase-like protein
MITPDELPQTLQQAIVYFGQGDNSFELFKRLRWRDGKPKCPGCGGEPHSFIATRKLWKCKICVKQFSIKVGTIFEDSPLGLDKWLCAIWMISNAKNGISSMEIHRGLGITQKSAWFMLHRIRLAFQTGSFEKMGGIVEADETFIGGKARNMHADVKARKITGSGPKNKTPVQGLLERSTREGAASRIRLRVLDSTKKHEVQKDVRKYVLKGSEVHTDSLRSYEGLADDYTHKVVDHAVEYVNGHVHTNSLENFWSLLKRALSGTYVSVEPFHLFRYLDEQAFRFNERKLDDLGRFLKAVAGVRDKRVTYAKLTATEDRLRPLEGAAAGA